MTMKLTEYNHAMTVFDGNRRVAVARKVVAGGWLLTATGFCWIDKAARQPNFLNRIEPTLWHVGGRMKARQELKKLIKTC